jgi:hypothetical protein
VEFCSNLYLNNTIQKINEIKIFQFCSINVTVFENQRNVKLLTRNFVLIILYTSVAFQIIL